MTNAEWECYQALVSKMGTDYYFFPQIHLDAIVQPTSTRKDRLFAFRHINQKSLDFVACGKKTLVPIFAIELDDKTHNQPKRIERDKEVERILNGAGIALIRIANRGRFEPNELAAEVKNSLDKWKHEEKPGDDVVPSAVCSRGRPGQGNFRPVKAVCVAGRLGG